MAKTFSLSDTGFSGNTSFGFSGVGGGETWAGKRFTIGGKSSASSTSIERITRTGMPEDVLLKLRAKRPPVDDSGEADLRWGKASTFTLTEPKDNQDTNPSYTSHFSSSGDSSNPEVPPEAQVFDFQEYARQVETIRVENPDDAEQWVEIERVQIIVFTGPDGNFWRYNFKYE